MMIKKKWLASLRGITLIEVVISIFIMTLLISLIIPIDARINEEKERRIREKVFRSLEDFLILSQKYCRENNLNADFEGELGENNFFLREGMKVIMTYRMPKGYKILQQSYGNYSILYIKASGRFGASGFTVIKTDDGKTYKLVINFQKNSLRIEELS